MVTTTAGRLVVEVVGDVSGLVNAYKEAQQQTETFEGQLKTVGDSLTKTGQKLTLGVTAPLTLMGGVAVYTAASFDDSMRQVQAVTKATGDEFEMLRQQAIDLGAQTAWSASESAEAQKYLAKAGLDVNEVYAATPQMLSLASAGVLDLGSAADISTNILSGFNLEVDQLGHVSDMLAVSSSSANTNVQQMGDAMAYVGPVASAANQEIEQTAGAIMIMSNAGIQGSMAGTSLRGSLSALLTPTAEAKDILASYGLTAADVDPQVHSLSEIVRTLGDSGISTADAMAIFGDRAGPGMIALISAGADELDDYTVMLKDCDGAAQEMAETMEAGLGGQIREFEGQLETLTITFGDLIAEALIPGIETVGDFANWLSSLDEGTQRMIVSVGLFAAAVGPATWALGSMAGGVSNMISLYRTYQASSIAATVATKGFTAAIAANPVGLAIIGLTSLAAILIPLTSNTEDATDAQAEYNEILADTVDLTNKSDKELQEEIETLEVRRAELEAQIELMRSHETPAIEGNTRAIRESRDETTFAKIAKGEFNAQVQETVEILNDETYATKQLSDAQNDAVISALELEQAQYDIGIQARELEQCLRDVEDGAEEAYRRSTQAVNAYRESVSDLQDQYDELKDAIDRALNIDEDIDDQSRDVERADIRVERAKQDLADIQQEINDQEELLRTATGEEKEEAQEKLTDLRLREREAVLDLADAEDKYSEALEDQQALKEEKTQIEKDLNGESIASAQERLAGIEEALAEETEKLQAAQEEQQADKIAHENIQNLLQQESLTTQAENWAKYVQFVSANPAIAETHFITYDADGNASHTPEISVPTIQLPEYSSLDLSEYVSSSESNNTSQKTTSSEALAAQGGGVNIENLTVVSPKADAQTISFNLTKTLRDLGSKGSNS